MMQLNGTIPTSIAKLSSLTYLGNANAFCFFLFVFCLKIKNVVSLFIDLFENNIYGSWDAVFGLTNLLSLSLGQTEITGGIPAGIGSLTQLTRINLYGTQQLFGTLSTVQ